MKLLYFTLGNSILDEQIRRQLVRIPEVLSELRKMKIQSKSHGYDAVMAFLGLNDIQNSERKGDIKGSFEDWVQVVQRGLFLRLRKTGFKYSGLIKRGRLNSQLSVESTLLPLLQSKNFIEIYVVGPGFDDLKMVIADIQKKYRLQCEVEFIDIIHEDKKLHWFWSEILHPSEKSPVFPLADLSRH
jgi:hypothetical protein